MAFTYKLNIRSVWAILKWSDARIHSIHFGSHLYVYFEHLVCFVIPFSVQKTTQVIWCILLHTVYSYHQSMRMPWIALIHCTQVCRKEVPEYSTWVISIVHIVITLRHFSHWQPPLCLYAFQWFISWVRSSLLRPMAIQVYIHICADAHC